MVRPGHYSNLKIALTAHPKKHFGQIHPAKTTARGASRVHKYLLPTLRRYECVIFGKNKHHEKIIIDGGFDFLKLALVEDLFFCTSGIAY